MSGYNGWANYETWNLALWIGRDAGLCDWLRYTYIEEIHGAQDFVEESYPEGTPDGVDPADPNIDWDEILGLLQELYHA